MGRAERSRIRTHIPGRVERVRSEGNTLMLEVKPLIKRYNFKTKTYFDIKNIPEVPLAEMKTDRAMLNMPVQAGTRGTLIVFDRSIDNYIDTGNPSPPIDLRMHDITDCIFMPGFYGVTGGLSYDPNNMKMVYDQAQITINQGGKIAIGKSDIELLDLFDQFLDAIVNATVSTMLGPQKLSTVIDLTITQIKVKLNQIKGSLA